MFLLHDIDLLSRLPDRSTRHTHTYAQTHLGWRGVVCMEAVELPTEPEAAEAPPGSSSQLGVRNDDGNINAGEFRRKRGRTATSAVPSSHRNGEDEEPSRVAVGNPASEDDFCVSLVEVVLAVCSQVDLFD